MDFLYCTIQDLRDEGLSTSNTTDARALKLIRRASSKINLFTGQWFWPVKKQFELDGRGSDLLFSLDLVPIIEIDSFEVRLDRSVHNPAFFHFPSVEGVLSISDYQLSDDSRAIKLLVNNSSVYDFGYYKEIPMGNRNVILNGTLGWIDKKETFVKTTLLAALSVGDTTIQIDTTGIEIDDVLTIKTDNGYRNVIVIDISPGQVTIEPSLFSASFGAEVICYGKIPELIRYSAIKLSILYSKKIGDVVLGGQASGILSSMITEEKTDEYRYRIDSNIAEKYHTGFLEGSTGDGEIDRILLNFSRPTAIEAF